jgi:hypothetical protein
MALPYGREARSVTSTRIGVRSVLTPDALAPEHLREHVFLGRDRSRRHERVPTPRERRSNVERLGLLPSDRLDEGLEVPIKRPQVERLVSLEDAQQGQARLSTRGDPRLLELVVCHAATLSMDVVARSADAAVAQLPLRRRNGATMVTASLL